MTDRRNPERDHRIRQHVIRDGLSYRKAAKAERTTVGTVSGVVHRTSPGERSAAMRRPKP